MANAARTMGLSGLQNLHNEQQVTTPRVGNGVQQGTIQRVGTNGAAHSNQADSDKSPAKINNSTNLNQACFDRTFLSLTFSNLLRE